MAAISSGAVDRLSGDSGTTFTLTQVAAGYQAGDVLLLDLLNHQAGVAAPTGVPSGAVALLTWSSPSGGNAVSAGLWRYTVPSTPPSSITFTFGTAREGSLVWSVHRPVDATTPLDAAVSVTSGTNGWLASAANSAVAPSVTTVTADAEIVAGVEIGSGSETITAPSGSTVLGQGGRRKGFMVSRGTQATPGATGTATFGFVGAYNARAWQVVLRPAGGGSGPGAVSGSSTASLTDPAGRWTKPTTRVSWFNQAAGAWAAILPTSTGHRLYTDLAAPSAGTVVDSRQASRATVVHDAGWTGVLRGHTSAPRFSSFDADYAPLVVDASVPLAVSNLDQSPTALLRSSNGYLWAANLTGEQVRVSRSTDNGASWSAAEVVVSGFTTFPTGVVGLAEAAGTVVLVASGNDGSGRAVRTISQGSASIASGSWATESLPALPGSVSSDDHGGICTAPDGRVLMVLKTTNGATSTQLIYLLARSTGGVWSSYTVESGPDDDGGTSPGYTRPGVTVDGSNVVVAFTSIYSPNNVWTRTAPLSDLSTWGARTTVLTGPEYWDGAQLPEPWHVRAGGAQWPLLANNTDTDTVTLGWVESANADAPDVAHTIVGARTSTGFTVKGKVTGESSARIKVGSDRWLSSTVNGSTGTVDGDGYFESTVTGLTGDGDYWYAVEGLTTGDVTPAIGEVRTLPADGVASFTFGFGSCYDTLNGSLTEPVSGAFGRLWARRPDMVFHAGDFTYADNTSTSQSSHRADLEQVIGYSATLRNVLARSGTTYLKSDHDAGGGNDAYPGSYTAPNRDAAKQVFPYPTLPVSNGLYHAFTVGRVRFIVTDTRSFMTSGGVPSRLGATQKAWFKSELERAEPVKVWVQEAAWIDDRTPDSPDDTWAFFSAERTELANHWATSGVGELVTIHGDQHALSADDGSGNSWGGFPSFCAAPFRNTTSLKTDSTGDWSEGFWPASVGAEEAQYGFCTVTDDGQQVTLAFRGYGTDDTLRVSLDVVAETPTEVTAAFTGSGTLTASAVPAATRAASFTGSGSFTAVVETAEAPQRAAAFTGTGSLSATVRVAVAAQFTGSGVLSAVASSAWARTAEFTGLGSLSATVSARVAVTAEFTGSGSLSATAGVPGVVSAVFTGSGVLSAVVSAEQPVAVEASFTGLGSFTADAQGVATFTVFTPPTVTERWPVSDRFFRRLTMSRGVTVLKKSDGLYYRTPDASNEDVSDAVAAYLGGHRYRVDEAVAAELVEAGYSEYLSTEEVFV